MRRNILLRLTIAVVLVSGMNAPCFGADQEPATPIPGFIFREGIYRANEPWQEGQPRITGLQQAFPKMKSVEENPLTSSKVSLGKLLYFDPILSGENTISCAHCHHPDFGFS